MQNRFGIIAIPRYFIHDNIKLLQDVWKCVTPIYSLYDNTRFQEPIEKFVCYSDKFEEVEVGIVYPKYQITLKRDENNELIDFEVEKIELYCQPIKEKQV